MKKFLMQFLLIFFAAKKDSVLQNVKKPKQNW